jgi:hypothetical protein
MLRSALATIATMAATLAAPAAHAGVQWSIGINLPAPAVVVSGGGGYYVQPAPVYVAPAPEPRYVPAPQYLPAPVYEAPRAYAPVVYTPPQLVYEAPYPAWRGGDRERWERHRAMEHARWEREHREHRQHHDDERRW